MNESKLTDRERLEKLALYLDGIPDDSNLFFQYNDRRICTNLYRFATAGELRELCKGLEER